MVSPASGPLGKLLKTEKEADDGADVEAFVKTEINKKYPSHEYVFYFCFILTLATHAKRWWWDGGVTTLAGDRPGLSRHMIAPYCH